MSALKTIEDFKPLVGQTIFAVPTGNNARHTLREYEKFCVKSCGRKYVSLSLVWGNNKESHPDNYLPKTGATQSDARRGHSYGGGFLFFASLESMAKHRNLIALRNKLGIYFRGYSSINSLPDDAIVELEAVLKKYAVEAFAKKYAVEAFAKKYEVE